MCTKTIVKHKNNVWSGAHVLLISFKFVIQIQYKFAIIYYQSLWFVALKIASVWFFTDQ